MARYKEFRQQQNIRGKRYYINGILPPVPLNVNDIYIITVAGDRLDRLSQEFFNTPKYWWVISAANPNKFKKDSYWVEPGVQIRIPINPSSYVDYFNSFNTNGR